MSTTIKNYVPEEGAMIFSDGGYQRVTSVYNNGFNYRSRIETDIIPSDKHLVDSCWETGNLYYFENNIIHKNKYNGDSIATLSMSNVVSLAVSQALLPMSRSLSTFREDNGCWVVRQYDKQLVKLDSELNASSTLINLSDPTLVISSDLDGGCYLFDDGQQWVMKINKDGEIQSYISYVSIDSSLTNSTMVKRASVDGSGNLWILIDLYIIKITLSDVSMIKTLVLNPLQVLSLSPFSSIVSDFDIDRSSSTIYVVGGCKNKAWLVKYNFNGIVSTYARNINMEYPVSIKVTQYDGSKGIYVITESDPQYLPIECETSSSSSSSEGYSSTSSSSTSLSSIGEQCCNTWEINFPDPSLNYILPRWTINDLRFSNTNNCRIWAEVYATSGGTVQTVNLYKSSSKTIDNLIANGSLSSSTSGNIVITQVNSSGVSGIVEWYQTGGPIFHPFIVEYYNSLLELSCINSSSSSSSVSESSSSSSSSFGYSSTSSSSFEMYDCERLACGTPIGGTSNACNVLTSWEVDGMTNANTKNGSLIAKIHTLGFNTYQIDLYQDDTISPDPYGPIVATSGSVTCSGLAPCPIEFSGNGISGSVEWLGYPATGLNVYTLITCPTEMSSSSSSTSAELCYENGFKVVLESPLIDFSYDFDLKGVTNRNSDNCTLHCKHIRFIDGRHMIQLFKDAARLSLVASTEKYIWETGVKFDIDGAYGISGTITSIFGGFDQLFRIEPV